MSLASKITTPIHCSLSRQFEVELLWTPQQDFPVNTFIQLRANCMRNFYYWKTRLSIMPNAEITHRCPPYPDTTHLATMFDNNLTILEAKLINGAKKGQTMPIHFRFTPPVYAGVHLGINLFTGAYNTNDQSVRFENSPSESIQIDVVAGNPERLDLRCRNTASGKVRVCILPNDRYGNPSSLSSPINLKLHWNGKTWNESLQEPLILELDPPKKSERLKAEFDLDDLSPGENISNGLTQNDSSIRYVLSNPVWPEDDWAPLFGDMHWHTEASGDGTRTLEDSLVSARDSMNLDFVAPSDHNIQGEAWKKSTITLDKFSDGDFQTMYGWEGSSYFGHQNYYFLEADHPLVCDGSAGFNGGRPSKAISTLDQHEGFIAIPHHTNSAAETRNEKDEPIWAPFEWSKPSDYLRLVEIFQCRGNQERDEYEEGWRGWHQFNGSSIQNALKDEHLLGFIGGSDNHVGWPGRAWDPSETIFGADNDPSAIVLTGVWSTGRDRASIFQAWKERRTWATWNSKALVRFSINDTPMGSVLKVTKGSALKAHLKVSAEDSFKLLELVQGDKIVWKSSSSTPDLDLTIDIEPLQSQKSWCYFRGILRNGGMVYASPVFLHETV